MGMDQRRDTRQVLVVHHMPGGPELIDNAGDMCSGAQS
jgi:hypothetical protein